MPNITKQKELCSAHASYLVIPIQKWAWGNFAKHGVIETFISLVEYSSRLWVRQNCQNHEKNTKCKSGTISERRAKMLLLCFAFDNAAYFLKACSDKRLIEPALIYLFTLEFLSIFDS